MVAATNAKADASPIPVLCPIAFSFCHSTEQACRNRARIATFCTDSKNGYSFRDGESRARCLARSVALIGPTGLISLNFDLSFFNKKISDVVR
jgi:hypothetical protein